MANYCFDYNPPDEHNTAGHRVILYPCHGMGQNQVTFVLSNVTTDSAAPISVHWHIYTIHRDCNASSGIYMRVCLTAVMYY